ncbi:hypothetical protein BG74_06575, partial [Sodalis-like endosymbiont of Proechinophthirus fluctus]
ESIGIYFYRIKICSPTFFFKNRFHFFCHDRATMQKFFFLLLTTVKIVIYYYYYYFLNSFKN